MCIISPNRSKCSNCCLVTKSHQGLFNPLGCNLPGSSVHGIEFSRQEYWSVLPFPSPEDLPDPGIKPLSPMFPALAGGSFTTNTTWEVLGEMQKKLLLLLSHFSRVRLCATPQTEAHQAPLSLGFSRQEHWSGLPFPSPMHESEK